MSMETSLRDSISEKVREKIGEELVFSRQVLHVLGANVQ